MKHLILCTAAIAAVLSLSACAGGGVKPLAPVTPEAQAAVDQGAAIFCGLVDAAKSGFDAYADPKAGNNVSSEDVLTAMKAYAGVREICKPPYTVSVAEIARKAMDAYLAIRAVSPPAS